MLVAEPSLGHVRVCTPTPVSYQCRQEHFYIVNIRVEVSFSAASTLNFSDCQMDTTKSQCFTANTAAAYEARTFVEKQCPKYDSHCRVGLPQFYGTLASKIVNLCGSNYVTTMDVTYYCVNSKYHYYYCLFYVV